jgi:hypothetical protein
MVGLPDPFRSGKKGLEMIDFTYNRESISAVQHAFLEKSQVLKLATSIVEQPGQLFL